MTDDYLASAYLDDEATPDERARVEADEDLLDEVEYLHQLRGQLADVEPPVISVREEQLASALKAWDRLPESERLGTDSDQLSAVATSSRRARRLWPAASGWMAAAAAALVLVVGAGVLLQKANSSDDDLADSAEPAELAEESSSELSGNIDESLDDATALTAEDIGAEADVLSALDEAGVDTDASHSASVDDLGPPSDADVRELPVLNNTEDLVDFAAPAVDAPVSDVDEAELAAAEATQSTLLPDCDGLGIDVIVGLAAYVNYGPVMVGVDQDLRVAIAYDPLTCAPVETVRIP